MSNLAKPEFSPLDISGKNYMPWTIDIETHLDSMDLHETIIVGNTSSKVDKAKSLIFLRRHLDENLKNEYLTVKDPSVLWKNLKDRFDHQRDVMLPLYRDKWAALRFQDFVKVNDYNSEMIKIVSHLNFCGDKITDAEMMEKTLSTFHASNVTLQQQYRVRGFEKYHELIGTLLVAERNNELLIKNHQSRPTGSRTFSEVHFANSNENRPMNYFQGQGQGRGRGRGRGQGRGRGRSFGQGRGRGGYPNNPPHKIANYHQRRQQNEWNHENSHKRGGGPSSSKSPETTCFRCGCKGHWFKTCRTPEHLCKLYQESVKGKGKEVNYIDQTPMNEFTRLGESDFNNEHVDTVGDFTNANEINFIENDPVNEYTHLGEHNPSEDFLGDITGKMTGGN
ncbi:unnamed protein product [Rhodiola kirilowii]